jgi:hypothetical protein
VRVAEAQRTGRREALIERLRDRHVLDTRDVPVDEHLTLGLFREVDVRRALAFGSASATCARRLVLRGTDEPGVLQVLEDVFNPARGLFVTAEYDERVWREERLVPHARVRVGTSHDTGAGDRFEPLVYPGGRVDVDAAGSLRRGLLHAGYALVGERELFVGDGGATPVAPHP